LSLSIVQFLKPGSSDPAQPNALAARSATHRNTSLPATGGGSDFSSFLHDSHHCCETGADPSSSALPLTLADARPAALQFNANTILSDASQGAASGASMRGLSINPTVGLEASGNEVVSHQASAGTQQLSTSLDEEPGSDVVLALYIPVSANPMHLPPAGGTILERAMEQGALSIAESQPSKDGIMDSGVSARLHRTAGPVPASVAIVEPSTSTQLADFRGPGIDEQKLGAVEGLTLSTPKAGGTVQGGPLQSGAEIASDATGGSQGGDASRTDHLSGGASTEKFAQAIEPLSSAADATVPIEPGGSPAAKTTSQLHAMVEPGAEPATYRPAQEHTQVVVDRAQGVEPVGQPVAGPVAVQSLRPGGAGSALRSNGGENLFQSVQRQMSSSDIEQLELQVNAPEETLPAESEAFEVEESAGEADAAAQLTDRPGASGLSAELDGSLALKLQPVAEENNHDFGSWQAHQPVGDSTMPPLDSSTRSALNAEAAGVSGEFKAPAPSLPSAIDTSTLSHPARQADVAKQVSSVILSGIDDGLPSKIISLDLQPAELGHLTIRVEQTAESISAQIVAAEQISTELLLSQKEILLQSLSQAGIENATVDIMHREQGSHSFQDDHRGQPTRQGIPRAQPSAAVQPGSAEAASSLDIIV
jgi:hypothetical protein